MSRRRFNFWLDDDLRDGLQAIRDREGIVESEQIRRAIRAWIKKRQPIAKERRPRGVLQAARRRG